VTSSDLYKVKNEVHQAACNDLIQRLHAVRHVISRYRAHQIRDNGIQAKVFRKLCENSMKILRPFVTSRVLLKLILTVPDAKPHA